MGNRSGLSVSAAEARSADGREEEHPSPEPGESAAFAASMARGRRADSEIARGLGLRGPAGRGADARYLEALAGSYHKWYDERRVTPLGDEPVGDEHRTRLWLAEAVRTVLASGLALVGVSAPERM